MKLNINNIDIHYEVKGSGKNIILIHGWGQSTEIYNRMIKELSLNNSVYSLDLPGFGQSPAPIYTYSTHDYASIVLEFIKILKIKSPTFIGHSFGGKVIIDLLTNHHYNPEKVILIASSGIKKRKTIIKTLKIIRYKIQKKLLKIFTSQEHYQEKIDELSKKSGSADYNNSKGIMRSTLVKIVNENYLNKLSLIKCPTLLIWGDNDQEVPLKYAKKMHKLIPDSGLIVIKKASHFPFLTHFNYVLRIIETFLRS